MTLTSAVSEVCVDLLNKYSVQEKVEEIKSLIKDIFSDRDSIPKNEWNYEKEKIMLDYKKKIQNRKKKGRKKNINEDQISIPKHKNLFINQIGEKL